jgi:hypothetical protein
MNFVLLYGMGNISGSGEKKETVKSFAIQLKKVSWSE